MTKIYTRTGDDGTTSNGRGERLAKDSLRIEALGAIDELNSSLGLAVLVLEDSELTEVVRDIQQKLIQIGTELATLEEKITDKDAESLEDLIDTLSEARSDSAFVLPGSSEAEARLHMARAVSRRAERRIVSLSKSEAINPALIKFLNRLSDLLFILAEKG